MAVFTSSSASTRPKGFAAGAAAIPAAGSASRANQTTARALRGAILRFHRDADPAQEVRGQHTAGAHDHRVVAYAQHLPRMLDGNLLTLDLLHVGLEKDLQHTGLGRSLHAVAVTRFGAIECVTAVGEHHAAAT